MFSCSVSENQPTLMDAIIMLDCDWVRSAAAGEGLEIIHYGLDLG